MDKENKNNHFIVIKSFIRGGGVNNFTGVNTAKISVIWEGFIKNYRDKRHLNIRKCRKYVRDEENLESIFFPLKIGKRL